MTLDTNVPEHVTVVVTANDFDFAVASVTDRETARPGFRVRFRRLGRVPESAAWGESQWGSSVWATKEDAVCLETVLTVINPNFPAQGRRKDLTPSLRRQLRDAMLFCAHVRAGRDIFLTNDAKAFVKKGRRETLEEAFHTRIMTAQEFIEAYGQCTC